MGIQKKNHKNIGLRGSIEKKTSILVDVLVTLDLGGTAKKKRNANLLKSKNGNKSPFLQPMAGGRVKNQVQPKTVQNAQKMWVWKKEKMAKVAGRVTTCLPR